MGELEEVLAGTSSPRLLVLGDLMLDRAVWGEAERVCPEAPALVLRWQRERASPGGAGSVAVMAQALGARVSVAGLIGDDDNGELLQRALAEAGIDTEAVLQEATRATTVKQRFLGQVGNGGVQQLLRADHESRAPLHPGSQRRLARLVVQQLDEIDAVLVADHGKGVCCPDLLAEVFAAARERRVPILVDPARGAEFEMYRGADLLLPNRVEAAQAWGRNVTTIEEGLAAARDLVARVGVAGVLLKLDGDGVVLAVDGEPDRVEPAQARVVRDVTGAGDMVLAVVGLCRAEGVDWGWAIRLASIAAGVAVGRTGATAISREELRLVLLGGRSSVNKVVSLEELIELADFYRRQRSRVVLTNGCFDLLHAGHAAYLEEARGLGDVLVVAINDDSGVRRLKGEGRPVVRHSDRAALVAALGCVDHVVVFSGDTPHEVLRRVRPDVLVKGGDYREDQVVGREVVLAYGGRVCVMSRRPGLSSTRLMQVVIQQACTGS